MGTPMRRDGTRDELVRELRDMAEGWDHLAKPKNSEAASEAADRLESGADSAVAGHTTYSVVPDSDTEA